MKLERLIIGAFASIVEAGTVVDTNTVSRDFYPDPATNGSLWESLGCVIDAAPETEVESEDDFCPSQNGGYVKESTETVAKDIIKLSLRDHSEVIHRLVWGTTNPMANGVAQTPFANPERAIYCWLHLQGRASDGQDRFTCALWGKLKLDTNPTWSKDATKPAVKFEILTSAIQSVTPNNIV